MKNGPRETAPVGASSTQASSSRGESRLLYVLATGSMAGMAARLVLSPLLPAIMDTLAITPLLAGAALSTMWAAGALVQYPGGRASDRLTRKTVLVVALVLLLVGSLILLPATAYPVFVIGAIAIGLGAGLYEPAAFTAATDLFVERRGWALSVNTAALNLGGVAAAGIAAVIISFTSWRGAFVPIIVLLGIVLFATHRWNDEGYRVRRIELDIRETIARLLRTRRVRSIALTTALAEFAWQSTAGFLPTYLNAEKGLSLFLAGNAFAGIFIIGVVANPVAGRVGDRFGHLRTAAVMATLASLGLATILATSSRALLVVGLVVFAVGLTAFWPVILAGLMAAFPDASVGGDLGATRTVYLLLGSIGPAYVGFVAGRAGYSVAFGGVIIALVLTIFLTLWLVVSDGSR